MSLENSSFSLPSELRFSIDQPSIPQRMQSKGLVQFGKFEQVLVEPSGRTSTAPCAETSSVELLRRCPFVIADGNVL